MADILLYADEYRCAIYKPAPGAGPIDDPNSPMNGPVLDPMGWIDHIAFHSSFYYYPAAIWDMARTITHPGVAGATTSIGDDSYVHVMFQGQRATADHLLLQHNLGYVPKFFVGVGGVRLPTAFPVQAPSLRSRFVTAYATTTQIRLREVAWSSADSLPAVNLTYQVVAFRTNEQDPDLPRLLTEPGNVIFEQGKFRANEPHLRAAGSGDVAFAQAQGRRAGINNGGLRYWTAPGTAVEFGDYAGSLPDPGFRFLGIGV